MKLLSVFLLITTFVGCSHNLKRSPSSSSEDDTPLITNFENNPRSLYPNLDRSIEIKSESSKVDCRDIESIDFVEISSGEVRRALFAGKFLNKIGIIKDKHDYIIYYWQETLGGHKNYCRKSELRRYIKFEKEIVLDKDENCSYTKTEKNRKYHYELECFN